jgi:Amt family ammonium transporter
MAAGVIIVYDAIMTFIILKIVSIFIPLRSSEAEVEGGDLAIHGVDPMPVYFPGSKGGAPAG